jgi:hypothetical protein
MLPAEFKPAIPGSERPQTHTLDRATTGIGAFIIQRISRSFSSGLLCQVRNKPFTLPTYRSEKDATMFLPHRISETQAYHEKGTSPSYILSVCKSTVQACHYLTTLNVDTSGQQRSNFPCNYQINRQFFWRQISFWHVYVLVGAYFVWTWKSREPSVTLTSHRGHWPLLIRVSGITWRRS